MFMDVSKTTEVRMSGSNKDGKESILLRICAKSIHNIIASFHRTRNKKSAERN